MCALILGGNSKRDIAATTGLSVDTVKFNHAGLPSRPGATNLDQLITAARRREWK